MTFEILMVTSEVYPLAKTGGLGDAVSGLARAVRNQSMPVTIMLPGWRNTLQKLQNVQHIAVLPDAPGGPVTLMAGYCPVLGARIVLVCNDALFDRDGFYVNADGQEYTDNGIRFAALSMAAACVARGIASLPRPAVLHVHDWHAALAPLFMHQLGVKDVKSVLTLHNVAFQGIYPMSMAPSLGIHHRYCGPDGMEFWGQLNFLKAGIQFADRITVVSRNYAREILTPRFGCGLEGSLAARHDDVIAIPNGIDTTVWDPAQDMYLGQAKFSAAHMENKALCKQTLQAIYGLPLRKDAFLLAMGSRLTGQKMADVAIQAIPMALEKYPSLQLCIMGKGETQAETALLELAQRYPRRCGVHIGYSEARAHLLHAGADALLHGSRFEPFGLTPLYAMRYGTVPLASRVGGMVDTIQDAGPHCSTGVLSRATGILFEGDSAADMVRAIERAMALKALPFVWRTLQRNAMTAPMGWERTAPLYVDVYRTLRSDIALDRADPSNSGKPEYLALSPGRQAAIFARSALTAASQAP